VLFKKEETIDVNNIVVGQMFDRTRFDPVILEKTEHVFKVNNQKEVNIYKLPGFDIRYYVLSQNNMEMIRSIDSDYYYILLYRVSLGNLLEKFSGYEMMQPELAKASSLKNVQKSYNKLMKVWVKNKKIDIKKFESIKNDIYYLFTIYAKAENTKIGEEDYYEYMLDILDKKRNSGSIKR